MKDYGLVSIITPNYNGVVVLSATIESVLAQTYQNWEMLIQDDGSSDDSFELVEQYARQDSRIKWERNEQNMGAAMTRNNAICRSKGAYLAFLDNDDLWLPTKLEKQLEFMERNECDFSFTKYEHVDDNLQSLGVQAQVIKKLTYKKLLFHCWPGCSAVMYKQDVNNKVFAVDCENNDDQEQFFEAIKTCKNAMGFDECLTLYRVRSGSRSSNKWKLVKPYIDVMHRIQGQSLLMSYVYLFTHMFVKTFFKYNSIRPEESVVSLCNPVKDNVIGGVKR
jgi:glycosyltransferase involved in cell wall biosynthesis